MVLNLETSDLQSPQVMCLCFERQRTKKTQSLATPAGRRGETHTSPAVCLFAARRWTRNSGRPESEGLEPYYQGPQFGVSNSSPSEVEGPSTTSSGCGTLRKTLDRVEPHESDGRTRRPVAGLRRPRSAPGIVSAAVLGPNKRTCRRGTGREAGGCGERTGRRQMFGLIGAGKWKLGNVERGIQGAVDTEVFRYFLGGKKKLEDPENTQQHDPTYHPGAFGPTHHRTHWCRTVTTTGHPRPCVACRFSSCGTISQLWNAWCVARHGRVEGGVEGLISTFPKHNAPIACVFRRASQCDWLSCSW